MERGCVCGERVGLQNVLSSECYFQLQDVPMLLINTHKYYLKLFSYIFMRATTPFKQNSMYRINDEIYGFI